MEWLEELLLIEEMLVENPLISRTRNLSGMFEYVQEDLGSHSDGQGTRWDAWRQCQAAVGHGEKAICNHRELPAPTPVYSDHLRSNSSFPLSSPSSPSSRTSFSTSDLQHITFLYLCMYKPPYSLVPPYVLSRPP